MNIDDIQERVIRLEEQLEDFEREYDMDEVRKKRREYKSLRRSKKKKCSKKRMQILKTANTTYDKWLRRKNKLDDLRKDLDDINYQIACGCQNCKRKEPTGEYSGLTPYAMIYKRHQANLLLKMRAFVFLDIDRSSEEMVMLCVECSEYFTNPEKIGRSFLNTWPSFVWSILMDKDILEVYGKFVWKFVPLKWRYWWIDAVHGHEEFQSVTIHTPSPIFKDITDDIVDMKRGLETNTLSELMRCCNKHLIPSVLCPWG